MLWFLVFKRPWNKPKKCDRIYFGRFGNDGRRADIERTLIVMTAALSIEEVSVVFANKIRRWSLEYRGVQCQSRSWKDKLFIRSANTTVSEREVELQFRSEDGVWTSSVKQFQCEAKSYSKLAVANLHEQKHEKKHNGIPLREARLNFSDSISSRDVTE